MFSMGYHFLVYYRFVISRLGAASGPTILRFSEIQVLSFLYFFFLQKINSLAACSGVDLYELELTLLLEIQYEL